MIPVIPTAAIPTAPIADTSDAWVIRRALHPDAPRLEDLLDDVEGFRTTSVYRHPLINDPSRRRDPDRFARTETLWGDLLGRSIRRPQFRLVAEGATARSAADKAWLSDQFGWRGWVQEQLERVQDSITSYLSAASPPIALRDAVSAATGAHFLLITAGEVADEGSAAAYLRSAAVDRVWVWPVEGAGHTGGYGTDPAEWQQHVIEFLDLYLLG